LLKSDSCRRFRNKMDSRIKWVMFVVIIISKVQALPTDTIDRIELSESEKRAIRWLFGKYDRDGDGQVTTGELQSAYPSRGQESDVDMVADMMRAMDLDGSGTADLAEFIDAAKKRPWARVEKTWEEFMMTDADGDGLLDPEEIKNFIMERFDVNDDGKIDRDEFNHAIYRDPIVPCESTIAGTTAMLATAHLGASNGVKSDENRSEGPNKNPARSLAI